jgi:hypothetical protein
VDAMISLVHWCLFQTFHQKTPPFLSFTAIVSRSEKPKTTRLKCSGKN